MGANKHVLICAIIQATHSYKYGSVSWISVTVSRSNGERLRHDVRNFITSANVGKYLKTSKECRIQYEMNDINRADEFRSKRMRTTRHERKKGRNGLASHYLVRQERQKMKSAAPPGVDEGTLVGGALLS